MGESTAKDGRCQIGAQPVIWEGDRLRLIDQTKLPAKEVYLEITDYREVARAIKGLKVRGAPAIGVAAAYGILLGALQIKAETKDAFLKELKKITNTIAKTRPTAKNLFFAVSRMEQVAQKAKSVSSIKSALTAEASQIHKEETESTCKLSKFGAKLLKNNATILTHCNTGPLATTGYGTALGVIIYAHEQEKKIKVYATETRPLCQGARLTTWELKGAGVPVTLITDSMAGYVMREKKIDLVIVGADRITANGDTANKIGTYSLAVLAKAHKIPFYVAAPTSTFDPELKSGDEIPIEFRSEDEVTHQMGVRVAPVGVRAENPAFDVTPHRLITAFITEKGIIRPPYGVEIKRIVTQIKP
ncbi:MAG: S-methyl-5-thioribose-1-phosphate isomerase [Chloroflexota bacterium]